VSPPSNASIPFAWTFPTISKLISIVLAILFLLLYFKGFTSVAGKTDGSKEYSWNFFLVGWV
jgi:hypothetical protein